MSRILLQFITVVTKLNQGTIPISPRNRNRGSFLFLLSIAEGLEKQKEKTHSVRSTHH